MSTLRLCASLVLVISLPLLAQSQQAQKKLYCWDEGGRRVCGDALPASAVDSARTEINTRTGLPGNRVGRALSAEERAAAEAEAEARRQAAEKAAASERADMALAESYDSEEALRRAFKIRYELVEEGLKSSQMAIDNQHAALLRLLQRAADQELAGAQVSPKLAENIKTQHDAYLAALAQRQQQQAERSALDTQLEESLARWQRARQSKQP